MEVEKKKTCILCKKIIHGKVTNIKGFAMCTICTSRRRREHIDFNGMKDGIETTKKEINLTYELIVTRLGQVRAQIDAWALENGTTKLPRTGCEIPQEIPKVCKF